MYDIQENSIATQTIIIYSNLRFFINEIFSFLDPSMFFYSDTVQLRAIYYKDEEKMLPNIQLHKKKKKCFRNSLNLHFLLLPNNQKVNIKVSTTGKFQATGCKNYNNSLDCIIYFLQLIYSSPHLFTIINLSNAADSMKKEILLGFQIVMTNIDFNVGFEIDRAILHDLLNNENTSSLSLLDTSFGYTGMNVKFPVCKDTIETPLPILSLLPYFNNVENISSLKERKPFFEISELRTLKEEVTKELFFPVVCVKNDKQRYNTFLVFHSGTIIMSGRSLETMELHYSMFRSLLDKLKPQIQYQYRENEMSEKSKTSKKKVSKSNIIL